MLYRGRFYIALFLFSNVLINFADRVNLSVAAPEIARSFHWDPALMGWIFSAYLWTYTVLLIPAGWLVDRFGTRLVSSLSIIVWSTAAMLTGAVSTLVGMIAARGVLGIGAAAAMPACNKVVRQWFPANERGFATAIFHSGVFVSAAVGGPLVAWLVVHIGWRWSFVIMGSTGFVWLVCWLIWFRPPKQQAGSVKRNANISLTLAMTLAIMSEAPRKRFGQSPEHCYDSRPRGVSRSRRAASIT